MEKSEKKSGGKRPGSGRKKLGHPTIVIGFRVRLEQADPIKKLVKNYLNTRK